MLSLLSYLNRSIREKLDDEWKETKANSWERWNWMLMEIKNTVRK